MTEGDNAQLMKLLEEKLEATEKAMEAKWKPYFDFLANYGRHRPTHSGLTKISPSVSSRN